MKRSALCIKSHSRGNSFYLLRFSHFCKYLLYFVWCIFQADQLTEEQIAGKNRKSLWTLTNTIFPTWQAQFRFQTTISKSANELRLMQIMFFNLSRWKLKYQVAQKDSFPCKKHDQRILYVINIRRFAHFSQKLNFKKTNCGLRSTYAIYCTLVYQVYWGIFKF